MDISSTIIQKIHHQDYELALDFIKKSYLENISLEDSKQGQEYFIVHFLYSKETYLALNNQTMQLYGYYINQELAGVISLDIHGYIQFLFVDKTYLKQRIGTQLLDYVIAIAKKRNQNHVFLDSSLTSYPFYLKYGFVKKSDTCVTNGMHYIPMEYEIKKS